MNIIDDSWCIVPNFISKEITDSLNVAIRKLIELLFVLFLLLSIEDIKSGEKTDVNKIRLAGCMIRLSFMGKAEYQKFEFIQQGLMILKSIDYFLLIAKEMENVIDTLSAVSYTHLTLPTICSV
eukprot:TRINITY_DN6799_c0_g1_i2.p1 TRINITY_DN6799_c0_g1~~TRINITY_DN6799_c0_g1_i2.p1  ORF type:complete len:124 (-),score=5.91 TRINITY_DN6799_c0_g1_i2:37-408(-)